LVLGEVTFEFAATDITACVTAVDEAASILVLLILLVLVVLLVLAVSFDIFDVSGSGNDKLVVAWLSAR